jgi:prevent-host-death family protein
MNMNVTATEAKNRLGKVLEQAQTNPVFIEKAGRRHSVVISNERYEELLKAEAGGSLAARKRRFNEQYKDWIQEQNQRVAKHGLWNEEFRRW